MPDNPTLAEPLSKILERMERFTETLLPKDGCRCQACLLIRTHLADIKAVREAVERLQGWAKAREHHQTSDDLYLNGIGAACQAVLDKVGDPQ